MKKLAKGKKKGFATRANVDTTVTRQSKWHKLRCAFCHVTSDTYQPVFEIFEKIFIQICFSMCVLFLEIFQLFQQVLVFLYVLAPKRVIKREKNTSQKMVLFFRKEINITNTKRSNTLSDKEHVTLTWQTTWSSVAYLNGTLYSSIKLSSRSKWNFVYACGKMNEKKQGEKNNRSGGAETGNERKRAQTQTSKK